MGIWTFFRADKSKLNIAYALYANNLKCDNFLTRLVRHMASQVESLMPEELVAMLIVIYLQKSWTPEGKSQHPTAKYMLKVITINNIT